jgi:hypothetical protein
MDYFEKALLEKHAGVLGNLWGKVPGVQKWRSTVQNPAFQRKRAIAKGVLGTAAVSSPVLYGAYKMNETPDPIQEVVSGPRAHFA